MSLPWPNLTTEEWQTLLGTQKPQTPPPTALGGATALAYRQKLLLLGGAGSGNFGHGGRPGEVGGSSSEGGSTHGPEKAEYDKRYQTWKQAHNAEWKARDAHTTLAVQLEQKYPEGTPFTDYDDKDFVAYVTSRDSAEETARALEDANTALEKQAPAMRKEVVGGHVQTVADRMGYDAKQVDVVDMEPRKFEVAGRQLQEGGHFDPADERIEVNARTLSDNPSYTQALVSHEIMHAQQHTVESRASAEHNEIRDLLDNHPEEWDRLFGRNGYPRPSRLPEVVARFPAAAALAKAHPSGDTYLGTLSEDADGTLAFDDDAHKHRADQMEKDDGFTPYSKLYWEAYAKAPPESKGHARQRAIQETLAEVAAYHDRAPRGPWKDGVPAKSWQKLGREIRAAYPTAKKKKSTR